MSYMAGVETVDRGLESTGGCVLHGWCENLRQKAGIKRGCIIQKQYENCGWNQEGLASYRSSMKIVAGIKRGLYHTGAV